MQHRHYVHSPYAMDAIMDLHNGESDSKCFILKHINHARMATPPNTGSYHRLLESSYTGRMWTLQEKKNVCRHYLLNKCERGISCNFFHPGALHHVRIVSLTADYDCFRRLNPKDCSSDDDSDHGNPLGGVGKINFGSDNVERLQILRGRIEREFPDITITFSSRCCMELTAKGVTKASGLAHLLPFLQRHLQDSCQGIRMDEPWALSSCCIAFGDGENDEVMLSSVAKGCLMANCAATLRERLPQLEVIKSNAEDGVAQKLEEVFHLSS